MNKMIYHPGTKATIDAFIERPSHALVLCGMKGAGKEMSAHHIAGGILGISAEQYEQYPYRKLIEPVDGKAITIEQIRDLQSFTALKIPGNQDISRIIVISGAEMMSVEAQNALLKTLEEPPIDCVIIMTVSHMDALLETIQSRVRVLHVLTPSVDLLKNGFIEEGFTAADIDRCMMLSGGLPGLTHALLTSDNSHPLFAATDIARNLLRQKTFERLLIVETLSKQKQQAAEVLFILGQMAHMALSRSNGAGDDTRWRNILKSSMTASEQLRRNVQPKLLLTKLMLDL